MDLAKVVGMVGTKLLAEVVVAVASTVAHHARPQDLIARFGGEEFCMIVPGLTLNAFSRAKLDVSLEELRREADAVAALGFLP